MAHPEIIMAFPGGGGKDRGLSKTEGSRRTEKDAAAGLMVADKATSQGL